MAPPIKRTPAKTEYVIRSTENGKYLKTVEPPDRGTTEDVWVSLKEEPRRFEFMSLAIAYASVTCGLTMFEVDPISF